MGSTSGSNIQKDEIIRLIGAKAAQRCPHLLYRIEFYDAEKNRTFEFLTNNMKLGATTICDLSHGKAPISSASEA